MSAADREPLRAHARVGNGKAVHEAHQGSHSSTWWTKCGWPIYPDRGYGGFTAEKVTCKTCISATLRGRREGAT